MEDVSAAIGVVDGAFEATTQRYKVVLNARAVVQLDDLLICRQNLPDGVELNHFGIVVECGGGFEGAQVASDTERIAARTMPGMLYRTVTVQTLRTVPELWIPPNPGAAVFRAAGDDRDKALFRDQMGTSDLNIGLDATLNPVPIDFRFLNGELGGHASISGISGVATKTSFAMHMLYMLLETERGWRLLGPHLPQTRCVVFNVKGEDLLHLDRPSRKYASTDGVVEQWARLGVEQPHAFQSVQFNVPPAGADGLRTAVVSRPVNEYHTFAISPLEFVRRGLLSYVFNEPQESQINFVIEHIRLQLLRHAVPLTGGHGAAIIKAQPQDFSMDFDAAAVSMGRRRHAVMEPGDAEFHTFSHLVTFLASQRASTDWYPATVSGTNDAFIRRLYAMGRRLGHLVRADAGAIRLDRHINVVDIHALHYDAQRFLVGTILDGIWAEKQGSGREPLWFVVLDELNKYAPREGRSPIKDILVDISGRGRSLGVILIGAQQIASTVESAVTDNASINVVGRLKAQHAREYRFLSPELQDRTIRLRPGMMVLEQPSVPAPLPITFPLAPFATNLSDAAHEAAGGEVEAAGDPTDIL